MLAFSVVYFFICVSFLLGRLPFIIHSGSHVPSPFYCYNFVNLNNRAKGVESIGVREREKRGLE